MKPVLSLLLWLLSRLSEASFKFSSGIDKRFLQHVIGAPAYVIGGGTMYEAEHPMGTTGGSIGAGWDPLEGAPLLADDTAADGGPHFKDHFPYERPHYNEPYSEIIYLFASKTKSTTPAYADSDDSSDLDDSWIL